MFYVYILRRPDGSPFYVGKGTGERSKSHLTKSHNEIVNRIIGKIRAAGSEPIVQTIFETESERDAFAAERDLITFIGRLSNRTGPLANFTDGGEGPAGWRHTAEAKEKNAAAHRGKKLLAEHRAKISAGLAGIVFTDQRRKNISAALTGRKMPPPSEEARRKLSAAIRGRKMSDAARSAVAEGCRTTRNTPEYRLAQAERTKATWTAERKAKQREYLALRWAEYHRNLENRKGHNA